MTTGETAVAGAALIKLYGFKAAVGMMGAAALYVVLPPRKANGEFDEREFVARLALAGMASCFFGDWVLQLLVSYAPALHAENHSKAVDLLTGAPAWWFSRGIALWFQKRSGRDIGELLGDIKRGANQ